MTSRFIKSGLSWLVLCLVGNASASEVKLDFEGIGDQKEVGDFYSGVGVSFKGGEPALAIETKASGGTGNIVGNPSPKAVMYFEDSDSDPDTVPLLVFSQGFKDGFSFWYSAINVEGTVSYFTDEDGSEAAKLGELSLGKLTSCGTNPNDLNFCSWKQESVRLAPGVTVKSIRFGGTGDQIAFDDVVLGVNAPINPQVPEPASLALVGVALLGASLARRRAHRA